MSKDEDIPFGEQIAFSDTHALIDRLLADERCKVVDVGRGVLVAATYALRKKLSNDEIAKVLYEAADDFAVRDIKDGEQ